MRRSRLWTLLAAAALAVTGAALASAEEVTLNALFMSQAGYDEKDLRAMTEAFTAKHPDIKVNLEFVPYEGLHDKIVLANGSDHGYDSVLIDVIWPAEFATKKLLLDTTDMVTPQLKEETLPSVWDTVAYQGRYYGMPWTIGTKYLFYNKEMLAKAGFKDPPKTWAELAEQARVLKQKGIVNYPIVWSWAQAEALICDYTALLGAYGGQFLDGNLKPAFQSGGGLDALKYMVATLKDGTTNPNSREYLEEDVRRVFQSGQAAFALNWTYMWQLGNDPKESQVAGKIGVTAAIGVDGKSKGTGVNGSMALAIPANSKHPKEAWEYLNWMASYDMQLAHIGKVLPLIWKKAYDDPAVTKDRPEIMLAAHDGVAAMTTRPMHPDYTEVSNILQKHLQEALLDQATPEAALDAAASEIEALK
ncbi:extracellular solute-binding protein [Labrys wisconsinensis]|uniref:Multiple sugar transport system substrate-binding protein n=1 Tax=Labrys wisconsinensis TaxID=425677 RepID=A0ABU0JLR6_9HYPH|nr:extracellular solute-binding protein [Labrys wisconsinensis]MDQ0474062.1 multiple sugar transport system substrate-binding protein [Labrys wisconsinensis]